MTTYSDIGAELQAVLSAFDAFCARARERLIEGHARYGHAWKTRDNLAALLEECEDAFVYGFFDWLRANEGAERHRRGVKREAECEAGE